MKGLFVLLATASLHTWAIANEIATQEDINPQNGYLREAFLSMESAPIEDNEAFLQEEYFDAGEQGLQRILNHGSSGKRCSGTNCPTTESYNFIVNKVNDTDDPHQWCLTAPGPTLIDYENLDFYPCDFNATNGTQLWRFDKYGMIHSQLDDDYCIVVDKGHNIFNNAKIRIAKCTRPKCLKRFTLKGSGEYKYIRTKDAPKYCVTNEGRTAETLDNIVAKKCKNRDDFMWKFQSGNSTNTTSPSEKFWLEGRGFNGCLVPFDQKVNDGNSLELGSCKRIDDMWQEVAVDNAVIFQTARDIGMCLQAANETLADDEWMRIKFCNTSEPLQLFEWNGTSGELSISSSSAKYCPTYQGASANKGDTIVIQNCTNIAVDEGWMRRYKRSHKRKKHPHKKRNNKRKKRRKKRKKKRKKQKKSCSTCY
jgi:hypothetical protein